MSHKTISATPLLWHPTADAGGGKWPRFATFAFVVIFNLAAWSAIIAAARTLF
jgi:hypothetical protein